MEFLPDGGHAVPCESGESMSRRRPRRNHTPAFKAKVALAAIRAIEHWFSSRSSSTSIPIRSRRGRRSSRAGLPTCLVLEAATQRQSLLRCEIAARQDRRADAGERFFRGSAHQGGIAERKAMIDRKHDLPISKQAEVLRIEVAPVWWTPEHLCSRSPQWRRRDHHIRLSSAADHRAGSGRALPG